MRPCFRLNLIIDRSCWRGEPDEWLSGYRIAKAIQYGSRANSFDSIHTPTPILSRQQAFA
jgi:hypothetical protein